MNFEQLQSRVVGLCKLEGWADVSPAPDWAALVNLALEEFSWLAEYKLGSGTVTLVSGTATYALPNSPPDWRRVTDAVLNSATALVLTDENQLRRENPLWISAANGAPTRFLLSSPNTIQFYPTPNAAGSVLVRGPQADGPLVDPTDAPGCPDFYHEGVALLAAWRHGKQYAQEDAAARVAAYRSEGLSIAMGLRAYLAEESAPAFQRRVRRSAPERIALGWNRWLP